MKATISLIVGVCAVLALATPGNGQVLPALRGKEGAEGVAPLRLRGVQGAALSREAPALSAAADGPRLWIVQAAGHITPPWRAALDAAGFTVIGYVPDDAYLVEATSSTVEAVARRVTGGALVDPLSATRGWRPLTSAARVAPDLSDDLKVRPTVAATAQFPDTPAGRASATAWFDALQAKGATVIAPPARLAGFVTFTFRGSATLAASLADAPLLANLERWEAPRKTDERVGQLLAGNLGTYAGRAVPSGPGYVAWLAAKGFTSTATAYPIIDIVDDGVDTGIAQNPSRPEFRELGDPGRPSRIAFVRNCTTDASAANTSGHGTLNAGIAAGYALTPAGGDLEGYAYGLGTSPFGRIGATKIIRDDGITDLSSCGGTDFALVGASYAAGSRITSNSWASGGNGAYNTQAQTYDALARDADPTTPGDQPMLHIFSAGNSGSGASGSVAASATAKNGLAVGASENVRQNAVADGCGVAEADNANDIASFSARGYTVDGRAKPDLVAPGTHIQGPAGPENRFTGSGVCGPQYNNGQWPPDDAYYPPGQTEYTWSSGTSHAAPAISGAAALVMAHYSQTMQSGNWPSPALVRAILINSARTLTGTGADDDLPGQGQGWGMPNLALAFDDAPRAWFDQSDIFTASGQTRIYTGYIAATGLPTRVTLAWTDAPGLPLAASYVNNLDLEVTAGGRMYRGNVFLGGTSTAGGAADAVNNVESVFLPAGLSGPVTVKVIARNIVGDGVPSHPGALDQDYALVIYNFDATYGKLAARVVAPDGTGISGASVRAVGASGAPTLSATSASAGQADLYGPAGPYTLSVSANGYVSQSLTGILMGVNLTTTAVMTLALEPVATVTGVLRDAGHGFPVGGRVTASSGGPGVTALADLVSGEYSMTLPLGASYVMTAQTTLTGYRPVTATVLLNAATTRDFGLLPDLNCSPAGFTAGFYGISQTFTASATPAGWSVVDNTGGGAWSFSNPHPRENLTGGSGNMAIIDSDHYGQGKSQDTELRTPAVNFLGEPAILLRFKSDFQIYEAPIGDIDISVNGAAGPWQNVWRQTVDDRGPQEKFLDVSAIAANQPNVMARFHYYRATYDWWWQVDDVQFGHAECSVIDGGLLTGRITGAGDGAPLSGVVISSSQGTSVTTGSDGRYALFQTPGTVLVTAVSPGSGVTATAQATVSAGQTVARDFVLDAPGLAIGPSAFALTVTLGASATAQLYVTNTGGISLNWQAYESAVGHVSLEDFSQPISPAALSPSPAFGGPDDGGYFWIDSHETGGPEFAWVDTAGGTTFSLGDDDEVNITLPFAFSYYTQTTSQIHISNNGGLRVGTDAGSIDYQNTGMADASPFVIAPFWDDLDTGGFVRWRSLGEAPNRYAVVEWHDMPRYFTTGGIGAITFQVILREDGTIVMQYLDVAFGNSAYDAGSSATVGIRGATRGESLQYSLDAATLEPGLAIRFSRGSRPDLAPWLATDPISGTGQLGGRTVTVTFDSARISQPGVYMATLTVDGNAPIARRDTAVVLTVLPTADQGLLRLDASTLGPCDSAPATLPGALFAVSGSNGISFTAAQGEAGGVSRWLPAGAYTATATGAGVVPITVSLSLAAGSTLLESLSLPTARPCAALAPTSVAVTATATVVTSSVQVTNTGAAAMSVIWLEGPSGLCNADVPWLTVPPPTSIPPGGSITAPVVIDSRGLASGASTAVLCAVTDDFLHPLYTVAVSAISDLRRALLPAVMRP